MFSTFYSIKEKLLPATSLPTHNLPHLPCSQCAFPVLPPPCSHKTSLYSHSWWVTTPNICHTWVLCYDFAHVLPQTWNAFHHLPTWKMIFSGFKTEHKHHLLSAGFCNSVLIPNLTLKQKNYSFLSPPIVLSNSTTSHAALHSLVFVTLSPLLDWKGSQM